MRTLILVNVRRLEKYTVAYTCLKLPRPLTGFIYYLLYSKYKPIMVSPWRKFPLKHEPCFFCQFTCGTFHQYRTLVRTHATEGLCPINNDEPSILLQHSSRLF